jgi:hypothetical protein
MDSRIRCNVTKCDHQIDKLCYAPFISVREWHTGTIFKPIMLPVCSSFKPRRSVTEKFEELKAGASV